jgi:hypothetical protein
MVFAQGFKLKKEASYLDGISVFNCDAKQMYGM